MEKRISDIDFDRISWSKSLQIIQTEVEIDQLKTPENTFNKTTEEKFPNLKDISVKEQKAYRTSNRLE